MAMVYLERERRRRGKGGRKTETVVRSVEASRGEGRWGERGARGGEGGEGKPVRQVRLPFT